MANLSSIARPYALAAFEYAREKQQLPAWKSFLETAAFYASQPKIGELMTNPELPSAKLFDLFHDLLKSQLEMDTERNNFLLLLAQNRRLNVLADIADIFNAQYAALQKTSKVRVITATESEESFRQKLAETLSRQTQREVTLQCEVDPLLIGGAIIHIGDRVIDGSIRGKLSRLLETLTG
jgi:F-type H+-transporting ATPase subunit delta